VRIILSQRRCGSRRDYDNRADRPTNVREQRRRAQRSPELSGGRERDAEARAAISAQLQHSRPLDRLSRHPAQSRRTLWQYTSVAAFPRVPRDRSGRASPPIGTILIARSHGICAALYVTESPIVRRPEERERQGESLIPSRDENDRPRNEISIRQDRQSARDERREEEDEAPVRGR